MSKILNFLKRNMKDKRQTTLVDQTRDEKIGCLANELIKELKASGRSIGSDSNFGGLTIWVHQLGKEDAYIYLDKCGKWEMRIKPTFNEF